MEKFCMKKIEKLLTDGQETWSYSKQTQLGSKKKNPFTFHFEKEIQKFKKIISTFSNHDS